MNRVQSYAANNDILSLFDFYNDNQAVASASIGQVYKARIRRGPQLEAAIGKEEAARWGGKLVAIKVQRPDVEASASLDMYLLRRTAMWLSKIRGGDLPKIADAFGKKLLFKRRKRSAVEGRIVILKFVFPFLKNRYAAVRRA